MTLGWTTIPHPLRIILQCLPTEQNSWYGVVVWGVVPATEDPGKWLMHRRVGLRIRLSKSQVCPHHGMARANELTLPTPLLCFILWTQDCDVHIPSWYSWQESSPTCLLSSKVSMETRCLTFLARDLKSSSLALCSSRRQNAWLAWFMHPVVPLFAWCLLKGRKLTLKPYPNPFLHSTPLHSAIHSELWLCCLDNLQPVIDRIPDFLHNLKWSITHGKC